MNLWKTQFDEEGGDAMANYEHPSQTETREQRIRWIHLHLSVTKKISLMVFRPVTRLHPPHPDWRDLETCKDILIKNRPQKKCKELEVDPGKQLHFCPYRFSPHQT